MTITCGRCGTVCKQNNPVQKVCHDCANKRMQFYYHEHKDAVRAAQKKYREKKKAEKPYIAGTGCNRHKTCVYGVTGYAARSGVCSYSEQEGHCKVIVKDGRKTVAPTNDCAFYKKKETGKDSRRKGRTNE